MILTDILASSYARSLSRAVLIFPAQLVHLIPDTLIE
jgi:hypothetical protein